MAEDRKDWNMPAMLDGRRGWTVEMRAVGMELVCRAGDHDDGSLAMMSLGM